MQKPPTSPRPLFFTLADSKRPRSLALALDGAFGRVVEPAALVVVGDNIVNADQMELNVRCVGVVGQGKGQDLLGERLIRFLGRVAGEARDLDTPESAPATALLLHQLERQATGINPTRRPHGGQPIRQPRLCSRHHFSTWCRDGPGGNATASASDRGGDRRLTQLVLGHLRGG